MDSNLGEFSILKFLGNLASLVKFWNLPFFTDIYWTASAWLAFSSFCLSVKTTSKKDFRWNYFFYQKGSFFTWIIFTITQECYWRCSKFPSNSGSAQFSSESHLKRSKEHPEFAITNGNLAHCGIWPNLT